MNLSPANLARPDAAALAERLAQSAAFARSKRHRELLTFLAARPAGVEWKETYVGHEFFGRPADYDPKADPVVRVEIRRLRERIDHYYAEEGASDEWRLAVPRGSYEVMVEPGPPAHLDAPAPPAAPSRPARPWWTTRTLAAALGLALALALLGAAYWARRGQPEIDSLAVLPLDLAPGGELDGLALEIAGALSRIPNLRVVGPQASARAGHRDLRSTAEALGVDAVMSGMVRQEGTALRVQLRLESGADQRLIWSQTLRRDRIHPFGLQDELAVSVAAAIHRELLHRPRRPRADLPDAVLAWRKGQRLLERRSAPAIREAAEQFRLATRLDPGFAAAWAALCESLAMAPDYFAPSPGWQTEGRAAGRRAMELDPENADAYAALGWLEFATDLKARLARRLLTRAVELNPNHVAAQRRLGLVLMNQRRFTEAEQRMRTALRLDPISPIGRINLAELFFYRGDFAREEKELAPLLAAEPGFVLGRLMNSFAVARQGRCGEALAQAERLLLDPDSQGWHSPLYSLRVRCGQPVERRLLLPPPITGAQWEAAFLLRDWPLVYQALSLLAQEQPATARSVAIGPDAAALRAYPPVAALFDQLERRIQQDE